MPNSGWAGRGEWFYYDFDLGDRSLSPDNLKEIEVGMKKIIGGGVKFERREVSLDEARKIFADQPYKLEIANDLQSEGEQKVSVYQSGDFCDLCRGPHVEAAKDLPVDGFKLTKIAGAYWKGGEKTKCSRASTARRSRQKKSWMII